jgi:hypothetical protein
MKFWSQTHPYRPICAEKEGASEVSLSRQFCCKARQYTFGEETRINRCEGSQSGATAINGISRVTYFFLPGNVLFTVDSRPPTRAICAQICKFELTAG